MSNTPTIDVDLAAKARASVIEEGEAGFDMSTWYRSNCNTTACCAGHIALADGYIHPRNDSSWAKEAKRRLFGLEDRTKLPHTPDTRLTDLFGMTNSSREEIIEKFDSIVKDYLPEDVSFDTYLHKSYGYQGYYRRTKNQNGQ